MSTLSTAATADTANGLSNPNLAYNLSAAVDYGPAMRFLNLMDVMRPWIGHEPGSWGGMTYEDLREGGYLDENGWVTEIPEGLDKVGTIWDWDQERTEFYEDRAGTYVLTYEGEGDLQIQGDARIISEEPGRIVFENEDAHKLYLNIYETDPDGTGDYIRDIAIVREEYVDLYEAGARFDPVWLELIQDARQIRFMEWNETNNSPVTSWEERNTPGGARADNSVPVEYMVQLANEIGADPWFTMPHKADEEYIREFATYVRDNLDPSLTARVEYSNEVWNWSFTQTVWLKEQALEDWGTDDVYAYHAMKATQTALIWEEVFGDEADDRLVNVLGTQAGNPGITKRLLRADVWEENDPEGFVDPASVFEEVAITTYFGSSIVKKEEHRDELLAAIQDPNIDAMAYLAEKLMDPDYEGSIPAKQLKMEKHAEAAAEKGLTLVAYEGGQHVHHSFSVRGLTDEELEILTNFMSEFVRSDEMADLYEASWESWSQVGDGPYMQFGEISTQSKWGTWGLYQSLDDENPRADRLEELNAMSEPWWDAEGGVQYQQGVTVNGTDEGELMVGTSQEDYLAGKGGNDTFVAGAGDDGIHGGDGIDRIVLSGAPADYTLTAEANGYRLTGPEGSDFLVSVEILEFDGGVARALADMLEGSGDAAPVVPETTGETETTAPETPDEAPVEESGGSAPDTAEEDAAPAAPETVDEPEAAAPEQEDDNTEEADLPAGDAAVALAGDFVDDAAPDAIFNLVHDADDRGVSIQAVNKWSALGTELDLRDENAEAAYVIFERGVAVEFDGTPVSGNYFSMQANAAGRDGGVLSDTALDTALHLGSVIAGADGIGIVATARNDTFTGRGADDTVYGGGGRDVLNGAGGDDTLYGGEGNDLIKGKDGNDILEGGAGNDTLKGGGGNDRFVFAAGCGIDIVTDLTQEDTVDLGDFLAPDLSFSQAVAEVGDDLVLSNGEDQITFTGLGLEDAGWVHPAV